jgi:hypothetical protein
VPKTCYTLGQTGKLIEMPATLFGMPTNTTTEARGSNSALVKTTGHARLKITLTLAVLADWMKLTQFLILKRQKSSKRKTSWWNDIKYAENVWMTENFKVEWLREFWHI